jgi:hypothetical protein
MAIIFDPNKKPTRGLNPSNWRNLSYSNRDTSFEQRFIEELATKLQVDANSLKSENTRTSAQTTIKLETATLADQLRALRKPIGKEHGKSSENPQSSRLKLVFSKS